MVSARVSSYFKRSLLQHNGMAPIKYLASRGISINLYKKLRTKDMKSYANIYFTRQCLTKQVTTKYANTNVP